MKILNTEQIRAADAYTIENEPIKSIDLMERAATQCYQWIKNRVKKDQDIKIFCGLGNNGGDGLAIGRMLSNDGYKISINIVRYSDKSSPDFSINEKRLKRITKLSVTNIRDGDDIPELSHDDIIIDALWGSGLTRPIQGFPAKIIDHINNSKAKVIAIDMPSGLYGDIRNEDGVKVCALYTLSFQMPKLSFFFWENYKNVGEWYALPIGLDQAFMEQQEASNFFITKGMIGDMIKPRKKFNHKGHYGHAFLIAGSHGKMGAAVLAAKACLRTGVGLLSTHIPSCGYEIMQTVLPEAMVSIDADQNYFSDFPDVSAFNVIGIGPGLGKDKLTITAFENLLDNSKDPIVIDADAINILGEHRKLLEKIPPESILTPHPKEFERIAGKPSNDYDQYELLKKTAQEQKVYIILKGAHSITACPDGACYFNSTGNPGMATAGSGDVLTGMILSLLAQGYSPKDACLLGVYLHGLAGDLAACKNSPQALIADDIIANIGEAYLSFSEEYRGS